MIHVSFEQADVNNSSRFRDRDGWVKISSDALDSATISPLIRTDAGDWFWSGSGGWDLDKSRPELKMTKWWYLSCKLLMSGLLMDCSCKGGGGEGEREVGLCKMLAVIWEREMHHSLKLLLPLLLPVHSSFVSHDHSLKRSHASRTACHYWTVLPSFKSNYFQGL